MTVVMAGDTILRDCPDCIYTHIYSPFPTPLPCPLLGNIKPTIVYNAPAPQKAVQ